DRSRLFGRRARNARLGVDGRQRVPRPALRRLVERRPGGSCRSNRQAAALRAEGVNTSNADGEARFRDRYFLVTDGLRLHYRDYPGPPGKPPLLCLPGLTRNVRDFADFAERYSPRFRVIALEFRGRGESEYDPIPARYNPLTYAGDVIQLLDELSILDAIFVGTSLGGLVTMTMAALAPQRIAAAILNDVGPELNQVGLDRIQAYVGKGDHFSSGDAAATAIA